MARFEIGSADVALIAPAGATGDSYYQLGLHHAAGRGGAADLVAAHKWLNVAVAKGCREAATLRAELAHEMGRDEIARAQREAREFLARR